MSESSDLFPEVVGRLPDPVVPEPEYPYFVVAYWPRSGGWWKVFDLGCESECERLASDLRNAGWRRVTILKLPIGLGGMP